VALIAPHHPKVGPKGGHPPMPLETMLRVYFLRNWYAPGDPMADETLYDTEAMRRFGGIEPGDDRIPDGPKGPWPMWGRVSPRDDPELPPPAGASRADASALRRGQRASVRQGHHAAFGHAGRRAGERQTVA